MLQRKDMHEYQKRAVEHIKEVPKCALWLDMGLGKTVSTLTAINDMLDIEVSRVLIIAPLRVCHTVYTDEIKKWEHLSSLTVSKILGTPKERIDGIRKKADIYVINRENIPWLVEQCASRWRFDMVVIDESSSFKNPTSKRFKSLKKVQNKIERMVQLTGTPSPNGYLDIWSQIFLLDGGKALGRTVSMYKSVYFDSDFMGYNYTLKSFSENKIQKQIAPYILSMRVEDYLELPDSISMVIEAPLDSKTNKLYKKFEKDFMLSLSEEEKITAMTTATLSNKLLQFCSGFVYDEDGYAKVIHKTKIEALKELIEENEGHNLLVAYNYKYEKEMILKEIKDVVELDEEGKAIKDWNEGKIKILLTHPASAGHGLNLQNGGSTIVWYGFTWSLELYQQFNARLLRQGQKNVVRIFHLATGDIEKKLMKTLSKKEITQDELLNSLK